MRRTGFNVVLESAFRNLTHVMGSQMIVAEMKMKTKTSVALQVRIYTKHNLLKKNIYIDF